MSESQPEPERQGIPAEPPSGPEGGEAVIPDAPMGVPAEGEPEEEPMPGIPENEPPTSG